MSRFNWGKGMVASETGLNAFFWFPISIGNMSDVEIEFINHEQDARARLVM